ncbi:MAG: aromatic ring-opening dioxygenase LigA [Aeromicrobium sp.]
MSDPTPTHIHTPNHKGVRTVGLLSIIAGIVLIVAGAATWWLVTDQLDAQNITVSEDAEWFGGDQVNGPLTAYSQAQVIDKHALEATDGKTYAELEQDDPLRETAMNASFLRASLFTSVVAYGVALFAAGMGLMWILMGWSLRKLAT